MARSFVLLALAGAAVAQSTVDLFLPMFDKQAIEATVVSSNADLTAYALACPTSVEMEDCGIPYDGLTVSQGPSSFVMAFGTTFDDNQFYTQSIDCKLNSAKDEASCTASVSGNVDGISTSTETAMATDYLGSILPVTIVSTGAPAPKTTSAPVSKTSASESESESETSSAAETSNKSEETTLSTITSTGTPASSGTPASTSSAPAETSSAPAEGAAGAVVPQNAILAGVAAILGGAMIL